MSEIENKAQDIVDEFALFDDWMQKYEHIIELGKELPVINPADKTDDKLIKGCQSRVWVHAEYDEGRIHYFADSDALITKGIISLLIRVISGERAEDIAKYDFSFIKEIGLQEHLSPTRSNGLLSMIKQIKMSAIEFSAKA